MALFNNQVRRQWIATMLLCGVVAAAGVVKADGNRIFTAYSTLFNPCNGESVEGPVDVILGVHVNKNGTNVNVFRQFHGTLVGNQGNTYKVSSTAHKHFDQTSPSFYDVEFHNNVAALGGGPSFEVDGVTRIFVDADQNPIGYSASGITFTCR